MDYQRAEQLRKKKEEIIERINNIKKEIQEGKLPQIALDYFMQGFATGSNLESLYWPPNNFDSLAFWGRIHKMVYGETQS